VDNFLALRTSFRSYHHQPPKNVTGFSYLFILLSISKVYESQRICCLTRKVCRSFPNDDAIISVIIEVLVDPPLPSFLFHYIALPAVLILKELPVVVRHLMRCRGHLVKIRCGVISTAQNPNVRRKSWLSIPTKLKAHYSIHSCKLS
jgi:hypothetical protein